MTAVRKICFATTNAEKLLIAETICGQFNIEIEQAILDIDEIQGENPELIVKDKAARAYKKLGHPVVVSDDSWTIPALNGFPGPYMNSISKWLSAEDLLRLMAGIDNRRIILHQFLIFTDGKTSKMFKNNLPGKIVHEPRGQHLAAPILSAITLDADRNKTLAEVFAGSDQAAMIARYKNSDDAWSKLVKWYENAIME